MIDIASHEIPFYDISMTALRTKPSSPRPAPRRPIEPVVLDLEDLAGVRGGDSPTTTSSGAHTDPFYHGG